jgi:hypothetical protein
LRPPGGDRLRVDLPDDLAGSDSHADDLSALDEALQLLERHDPDAVLLVKLRYFAQRSPDRARLMSTAEVESRIIILAGPLKQEMPGLPGGVRIARILVAGQDASDAGPRHLPEHVFAKHGKQPFAPFDL